MGINSELFLQSLVGRNRIHREAGSEQVATQKSAKKVVRTSRIQFFLSQTVLTSVHILYLHSYVPNRSPEYTGGC